MKTIKIPFSFEGGGVAETDDVYRIQEQKIANVLVTSNLERVFLPKYGAGAVELLYELNDPLIFFDFKTEAMFELKDNISTCSIRDISARTGDYVQNGEETVMTIDVVYELPLGSAQIASIGIANPGQITEDTTF